MTTEQEQIESLKQQVAALAAENARLLNKPKRGRASKFTEEQARSWDWSKTTVALARELGVSVATVHRWRHQLNQQSSIIERKGLDWTKPNVVLSREHGVAIASLRMFRLRHGIPEVAAPRNASSLIKEREKWDWSKTDMALSKEHGMTRERVRQIRCHLGKPPSSERFSIRQQQFAEWVAGRKEILFLDAKRAGFHEGLIKSWCRNNGVLCKAKAFHANRKHPWHLVNWALPNCLIEEAWGFTVKNIVASYRCTHGSGKSPYPTNALRASQAFADEKAKAVAWREQQVVAQFEI